MLFQKWKRFLGGLNLQFIAYFLLFAYIPLLAFSIIGYHLNKRLIYQVHQDHLKVISLKATQHINDYLTLEKNKISQLYSIKHLNEEPDHLPELTAIALLKDGKTFSIKNNTNLLQNDINSLVAKPDSIFFADSGNYFFFSRLVDADTKIWAALPNTVLESLLCSEDPYTSFEIRSGSDKRVVALKGQQIHPDSVDTSSLFSLLRNNDPLVHSNNLIGSWTLVATRSAQGIYGELDNFLREIFLANLIIGILMFGIAIALARRVVGPIEELVVSANRFSEGDLKTPVAVRGSEEINILSAEFELMRQKLLESYTNLEGKVEERTEALREAQFQISHQEKMASLGLLAAGVAHEIGNPLTGISSMAQIIKRRVNDENIEEYINTILSNISRISRIVRELVDFTRPSSYEAKQVDANTVIESAIGIARYDKRAKNIDLEMDLEQDLPSLFLVEDQLLQVFINILINAMDACIGDSGLLTVRTFSENNNVYIHFTDNGVGIPKEHQAKIFEPFFTTKKVGKGTGLGLSVSYGIIKNLNGTIKVESTPGTGSTFKIEIPITETETEYES